MKNNVEPVIDFLAAEEDATCMSVEEWFDTYGVLILKREEAKAQAKQQSTSLKAKCAAAGR